MNERVLGLKGLRALAAYISTYSPWVPLPRREGAQTSSIASFSERGVLLETVFL